MNTNETHGQSKKNAMTPEYLAWRSMKQRCNNANSAGYQDYGGRGIKICDEWQKDAMAFIAHVGLRPSASHSIDRIDTNGNYEPGNVRWATAFEQSVNRRNVRQVVAFGKTHTLREWAAASGQPYQRLHNRIVRLGWDAERAINATARGSRT